MRPIDKATADSLSVQSFAIIKNTGHGNVIGRFKTRAGNGLSVWSVHSRPLPHGHPFSDFFSPREGAAVHKLKRIIHLQTVRQHRRIKLGGLFIQN